VTAYTNGLAGLETDLGTVPRVGFQEINTPKLDYQINPKEHVSVLFHRLRWDAPGDVQTASSATYSVDAFGTDFVKLDYGVAKLTSNISSKIVNEVLYQYSRELDDEGQQQYSPYTLANLVAPGQTVAGAAANGPGGTIPYVNLNASGYGFYLGSPYYSYRLAYPEEWKWQADDILYYTAGNHSIRMGFDLLHNYDLLHQTPYYYGYYSYANVAAYLSDLYSKGGPGTCGSTTVGAGVGTTDCYSSVTQDYGATEFAMATMDYAGFVQDNWKVSPRLTLELGVRYDYEHLPAAQSALTTATGSFVPYTGITNVPDDKNNFGPRIGFSMDVFGTGATVLRGGFGMYYGRILNGTVATAQFGSGSPAGQFAIPSTKPTATTAIFPNPVPAGGSGSKPSSFYFSAGMQNPEVDEYDLQVQQQLGKGTVFQVSYIGALGRELPNFLDTNLSQTTTNETITVAAPSTSSFGNGPLAIGTQYVVPTFTGYANANFGNITEILSNINSNYNALVFEVQNRSIHGFQFDANYTWSHALDYNQNASSTTSTNNWLNPYSSARQNYATSAFNVGNRFVGYVLYHIPGIEKGGPLKYLTNGWNINDTFQMQNGLPYSATIGSGYNSAAALNSSWNGAPSVYYLPPIGINTFQVPRATVDDVRLQKDLLFATKYDLQLNADLYNVANHENFSTSDISTTAYNFTSNGVLAYQPRTATGVGFGSHSTANDSGFLYTPRNIQIGVRLEF
jgi:hypothetical protein